ncbi:uncharacterized protein LOC132725822, partial [Ruditapes philippinarum]|uniref:uncharacterized protein LOC132725822 n=1 Tax=Ruditapes philippinarum TaxID=129788 RepID=UPI00295B3AAE
MYEYAKRNLIESGQQAANIAEEKLVEAFFHALGISEDSLLDRQPYQAAATLERNDLIEYLQDKNLPTDGSLEDLQERYKNTELSCSLNGKQIRLPDLPWDFLHYTIADDCMRIDAYAEIRIRAINYTRTFSAYVELDPCQYVIKAAFERTTITLILFEYNWGKEEMVKLVDNVYVKFRIDKDDIKKVFLIDLGITCDAASINQDLLKGFEIPIPICNGNFSLQGSLSSIKETLGGQINREVFDLVLKQLGIDRIIQEGSCKVPPPPSDCPPAMNISNMIPPFMRNILQCELADNCFGVTCCVNFGFTIPFSSIQISISFPVWFKMDPCDFRVDTGIGSLKYEEQLLKYEW